MRFSNLHQHSTFSDGIHSMEEVVQAAIARNFVSIGFSDHSFTPCDTSYCMKAERYPDYFSEIHRLKEKYVGQIDVLTGLELDYYSTEDRTKFDYWIASVHYLPVAGELYAIDHAKEIQEKCIAQACRGDWLDFCKRYYDLIARHVSQCKPDIVGHFDVIAKFGLLDETNPNYQEIALEALDEVMKTCPLIEMNTGAIARGIRKMPYPHVFLLERILQNGGEVILSADSHRKETIDCFFPECCELLKQTGFDHVVQRWSDGFHRIPLK